MSELTPFGIAVRKLRLEKGQRLLDMAHAVGKSVAFLSAIETGRKPIPDGFVALIGQSLDLTGDEIRKLRVAADQTRKEVRVDKLSSQDRELVAAFARRLDDVPETLRIALRKIVLKSQDSEVPFKRQRRGMLVPPMSIAKLRHFAEQVRDVFVEATTVAFPIMDVLEFRLGQVIPDFVLDVQDQDTMGQDEGRVVAGSPVLTLRSDIYEGAWNGVGRDRFTASHEFAHFLMHRTITFARTREDTDKIYCDAEWQADSFAGTLLMSPRHVGRFRTADEAADACTITRAAAGVMWAKYSSEGLLLAQG
jgi:transcriptional regulator with XRE-family HTH domain